MPRSTNSTPKPARGGELFEVLRPAQLEAVVSMRRHDIVDHVLQSGPMTVKEIADALGVAPSSLYYHIEHLCEVGLLREAGIRRDGPKSEQIYATPARRMTMLRALQEPRNARVIKDIVNSLCKQASKDFANGARALHRLTAGARRNTRFFRLVGRPDAATLEQINAHLDAITELMIASAQGGGARVSLAWVLTPLRVRTREDG